MLTTYCPHCRGELEPDEALVGQSVECPLCQGEFTMRASSASAPPVPAVRKSAAPFFASRYQSRGKKKPVGLYVSSVLAVLGLSLLVLAIAQQRKNDYLPAPELRRQSETRERPSRESEAAAEKDRWEFDLTEAATANEQILGRWQSTDHIVRGDVTIVRDGPLYYAEWSYSDGSQRTVEILETPSPLGRRLDEKDSGDYYLIRTGGLLEVRDPMGLVFTCALVRADLPRPKLLDDTASPPAEQKPDSSRQPSKATRAESHRDLIQSQWTQHQRRSKELDDRIVRVLTALDFPDGEIAVYQELNRKYVAACDRAKASGGLTLNAISELANHLDRLERFVKVLEEQVPGDADDSASDFVTPERRAAAMTHLKSRGATLRTDDEGRVLEINLNGVAFRDERDYLAFSQFPHCRKLNLKNCKGVSRAAVVFIGEMKELRGLDVSYTAVGDDDLIALENLSELNTLSLWETKVTSAGLKHLYRLANLRKLYLPRSTSQISNESVRQLTTRLPLCEVYR